MSKKTLMIIMPEGGLSEEFSNLLSSDFILEVFSDEETAFKALDDDYQKYSAVLVDLKLTRSTDYKILSLLKQDIIFASLPVIAISESEPKEEDMDVFNKGFSELLAPPAMRELLVNRINNAIRAKDSFTYSEMQKMLKQLPSNIYLKDSKGRYVFCTQYWHHLDRSGEKHWTIRGKTDYDIRKDKQNALKAMETDREMLRTGIGTNYIIEENEDGIQEFLELVKRPVVDDEGNITGIIALINDVTEKELLKIELERRSKTDSLTGLLNKGAAEDLTDMLMRNNRDDGSVSALIVIDADHFKQVNDNFGHIAGDRVLATIGRLINNGFKGRDVAGRIGGDEFMVFLRKIDSADIAVSLAEKLQSEVVTAFSGELKGCITLSIGIAMYPDNGKDFKTLFKCADEALYYVKKHGRASCHVYDGKEKTE